MAPSLKMRSAAAVSVAPRVQAGIKAAAEADKRFFRKLRRAR